MVLRSTQTLKEISMSCLSWGQRRPVRSADNLATFLFRLSRNFGSLNLLELRARPGLERDCFYPFNKTLEGPKTSMNSGERNISVLSKNRMRIRRSSIPWTVVSYNNLCRYMSDRWNLETKHSISDSLRYLLVFSNMHIMLHESQPVGASSASPLLDTDKEIVDWTNAEATATKMKTTTKITRK